MIKQETVKFEFIFRYIGEKDNNPAKHKVFLSNKSKWKTNVEKKIDSTNLKWQSYE